MKDINLKQFEKRIVIMEFSEYLQWSKYVSGILIFSKNGVIVYTGKEKGFFGKKSDYYFEETNLLKDCIPYENIVSVLELTDVKSLGGIRLNNISEMLKNTQLFGDFKPFKLEYSEQMFVEDVHKGMVFNPYSNKWSFL